MHLSLCRSNYQPLPEEEGAVMAFPLSPFKVKVLPTYDASKVTASGPGLSSYGIPASLPVEFAVDAKDAGQGLLAVQITVSNCKTKEECCSRWA